MPNLLMRKVNGLLAIVFSQLLFPSQTPLAQTTAPFPFTPPPTKLEQVQQAIRNAGANWIAAETSNTYLSPEAKKRRLGLSICSSSFPEAATMESGGQPSLTVQLSPPPVSFDWRDNTTQNAACRNCVTSVKNQGHICGSCWAFATTATLESRIAIDTGALLDLAEQTILSCGAIWYYPEGGSCQGSLHRELECIGSTGNCDGGCIWPASTFLQNCGLPLEIYYPYIQTDGISGFDCRSNCCPETVGRLKFKLPESPGYVYINLANKFGDDLRDALISYLYNYGPLVVTMEMFDDFHDFYAGDVYSYVTDADGMSNGGHVVELVGYDRSDSRPERWHFIAKNSWGTRWGQEESTPGFFRIAFGELWDGTDSHVYDYFDDKWKATKVEFGKYAMYYSPASASSYPSFGSIKVTINQQCAVESGAQWRIVGSEKWLNSDEILAGISPGIHRLEFKSIPGWTEPTTGTDTDISILNLQITQKNFSYTPISIGSLTVTISPQVAQTVGAKWRVQSGNEWSEWKDSGYTFGCLSTGNHVVEFKDVAGWIKPMPQTVSISSNTTTAVSVRYASPFTPILSLLLLLDGPTEQLISVSEPVDGLVTVSGAAGSVQPGVQIQVTNNSTGDITIVSSGEDGSFSAQIPAQQGDVIVIAYVDSIAQTGAIPRQAQSQQAPNNSSGFPEPPESPIISAFIVGGPLPPPMPPL